MSDLTRQVMDIASAVESHVNMLLEQAIKVEMACGVDLKRLSVLRHTQDPNRVELARDGKAVYRVTTSYDDEKYTVNGGVV